MGQGVMMTAAALSAPMLVRPPLPAQWVMREVDRLINNNTLQLVTPMLGNTIGPISSAITCASAGSLFGPVGTTVGLIGGLIVGNAPMFSPSREIHLAQGQLGIAGRLQDRMYIEEHGYTMLPVKGKMMLVHREVPPSPGIEGLIGVALLQATLRGVNNICRWNKSEMAIQDVGASFCRDIRDGVLVYCTVSGAFKALSIVESRAAGTALSHLCGVALRHPMPVMYGVLGAGWLVIKLTAYAQGQISWELLKSEAILTSSSTTTGIVVGTLCSHFGVAIPGGIGLTLSASHAVGMCVYESWRNSQQRYIEERLCRIAREVMGLPPGFTAEELHTRWKLLVRYAHPDRNTMPDAKTTTHIFTKCREVLRESLGLSRPPASRFDRLLRYFWRWNDVDWLQRRDLPPTWKYSVLKESLVHPPTPPTDVSLQDERHGPTSDLSDDASVVFSEGGLLVQDTDLWST